MTTTLHAEQRTARIVAAGLSTETASAFLAEAEGIARSNPSGSLAALLWRLPKPYGTRETSNGDQVWAIIRDGDVVTLMLRRSDQPTTPGAMSVDRLI